MGLGQPCTRSSESFWSIGGKVAEFLNMETGELVDSSSPESSTHKLRTTSMKKYVGIDTKWPSECLTIDHLMESLSQLDSYAHGKVEIDYQTPETKHLLLKLLTHEEWMMLQWLSQKHLCMELLDRRCG